MMMMMMMIMTTMTIIEMRNKCSSSVCPDGWHGESHKTLALRSQNAFSRAAHPSRPYYYYSYYYCYYYCFYSYDNYMYIFIYIYILKTGGSMRLTLFQEGHRHSHVALRPHVTVDISTINPVLVKPVTTQLSTV